MSSEKNSTDIQSDAEKDPGLSRLYRESSREVTPEKLDEDIMQYARKNLRTRRPSASPFSSNWTIPVSLAAVLLISVALVPILRQELQSPRQTRKDELRIPVTRPATPEKKLSESAPAQEKLSVNRDRAETATETARAKSAMPMKRQITPPAPATLSAPEATEQSLAATIRKEKQATSGFADTTGTSLSSDASSGSTVSPFDPKDPLAWLKHIQQLLEENKTAEARTSYQAFVRQYPKYPAERVLGKKMEVLGGQE